MAGFNNIIMYYHFSLLQIFCPGYQFCSAIKAHVITPSHAAAIGANMDWCSVPFSLRVPLSEQ